MTLSLMAERYNVECCLWRVSFMLKKPFMLSVVMLNVIMLNVTKRHNSECRHAERHYAECHKTS